MPCSQHLLCSKNQANVLLLIPVHPAYMQLLPVYNVCVAHFQHLGGVSLLVFVCDFGSEQVPLETVGEHLSGMQIAFCGSLSSERLCTAGACLCLM